MNYSFFNTASKSMERRIRRYAKEFLKSGFDGYDVLLLNECGYNRGDILVAYIWFKGEIRGNVRIVSFGELKRDTPNLDEIQKSVLGRFDIEKIFEWQNQQNNLCKTQ